MTNNEAAKWIQLYIDLAKNDPTTGEAAYLNDDAKKTIEAMEMAINALTAQPEETHDKRTKMHACDCVSRQAAIDETWKEPSYTDPLNVLTEMRDRLMGLPSIQPEVIRCKDCKRRPKATRADENVFYGFSVEFPDEKCPCHCEDGWYGWYPDDDFYCGYAERRTDG